MADRCLQLVARVDTASLHKFLGHDVGVAADNGCTMLAQIVKLCEPILVLEALVKDVEQGVRLQVLRHIL